MGPLRAEKRTDKNGRVVTRHVRADGQNRSSARTIPAPAVADASAADRQREQLAAEVLAAMPRLGEREQGALRQLRIGTLRALREAAGSPGVAATLIDVLKNELRSGEPPRDEAKVRLAAAALPLCAVLRRYGMSDVTMLHGDLNGAFDDGGFDHYLGPVGDQEERLVKAYMFSYAVGLSRWQYPLHHQFVIDVQSIADRITEVEECLPLLARSLGADYSPCSMDQIEAALDAAQKVPAEDRERLASFMLDRGMTDIPEAASALRGVAAPLQTGAL